MSLKNGTAPFIIICGIVFFGALHHGLIPFYPADYADTYYDYTLLQNVTISRIEITYTEENGDFVYRFYKIESVDGVYYSNTGKEIDVDVVANFEESFTDLYESGYVYRYNNFFTDYFPHFDIVVTLADGRTITIESYSDYHCFIPWNITYNDTTYTQYNGKIPSALLKMLFTIDEYWLPHDKEARYGCYSAAAPYTLSQQFPQTEYIPTPAEERGKRRLVWQTTAPTNITGPPVYSDGNLIVALQDRVLCVDAETGTMVWEVPFERGDLSNDTESIVVHDSIVYVGAPDSFVYSIDKTGLIRWTYKTTANTHIPLKIVDNYVIGYTGGIICLNPKTGELMWEIPDDTWDEQIYNGTLLFSGIGKDHKSYYALLTIGSGEILWKEDLFEIQHPIYHKGALYFGRPAEKWLMYVDVTTLEEIQEIWFYPYDENDSLLYARGFGDFIILLFYDDEKELLDTVVVINTAEMDTWKYTYTVPLERDSITIKAYQNIVFVLRQGGYIDAFSIKGEEKLWETEIRGTEIINFDVHENKAYVSANDGRIYCLDLKTGDILWSAVTEYELLVFPEPVHVYITLGDELLFVATVGGNLYAFSL